MDTDAERRRQLAQGLIRLDQALEQPPDTAESGAPQSLPPPTIPPAGNVAPNVALSQILRRMSARFTVQQKGQLAAASGALRTQGIRPSQDAFFYTDAQSMNTISHALEERVISERLAPEVYAGFQRLSLVGQQLRRYRPLVEHARYVYLYGINDVAPHSAVATFQHPQLLRFIIRPKLQTGLEWFWFVVIDDPRLQTALLAQQIDGDLWAPNQIYRTYMGLWTFDPAVVGEIIAALRQAAVTLYYGQ